MNETNTTKPKDQERAEKRGKRKNSFIAEFLQFATDCRSLGQLVFRCFMMIAVPYLYLFTCGYLDRYLVQNGFAYRDAFILFVFFSLLIFWAIGITLVVLSVARWNRKKKNHT